MTIKYTRPQVVNTHSYWPNITKCGLSEWSSSSRLLLEYRFCKPKFKFPKMWSLKWSGFLVLCVMLSSSSAELFLKKTWVPDFRFFYDPPKRTLQNSATLVYELWHYITDLSPFQPNKSFTDFHQTCVCIINYDNHASY